MIIFVVLSGIEFPNYQYAFSFLLALWSAIGYFVIHLILHRREKMEFVKNLWNRDAILIGAFWAVNYVFLLVSNPYTPGMVQVILNELNIIVVVVYSKVVHKKQYHIGQWISVIVMLAGGLIPIFQSQSTATASHLPSWVWYIFFTFGTVPIALANVRTERILQDDTEKTISVPLFYSVINVWTLVFVLGLFWFPGLAVGSEFWNQFIEGMKAIMSFNSRGSAWTWAAIIISFASNIFTALLSREEDATFATVVLALAPGIAGVLMGIKPIMSIYYQSTGWTTWVSMAIVMISVIMYKVFGFYMKKRQGYTTINP